MCSWPLPSSVCSRELHLIANWSPTWFWMSLTRYPLKRTWKTNSKLLWADTVFRSFTCSVPEVHEQVRSTQHGFTGHLKNKVMLYMSHQNTCGTHLIWLVSWYKLIYYSFLLFIIHNFYACYRYFSLISMYVLTVFLLHTLLTCCHSYISFPFALFLKCVSKLHLSWLN